MKEHIIKDPETRAKALADSLEIAKERLNGVGLKDPREILEMLFDEVESSEYKTEQIKYLQEIIDNLKRQIK